MPVDEDGEDTDQDSYELKNLGDYNIIEYFKDKCSDEEDYEAYDD
jgi:hypothetical protein